VEGRGHSPARKSRTTQPQPPVKDRHSSPVKPALNGSASMHSRQAETS
jgi:hypothetical protein